MYGLPFLKIQGMIGIMKIYLRDRNIDMCQEWANVFKGCDDVIITTGDIFGLPKNIQIDAIVSPAQSFGFMDGGIDYFYSMHFGWDMSAGLRQVIRDDYDGEVLVGQAVIVGTGERNAPGEIKSHIPYLISAPTMRVPMDIAETVNAYLAFRAVLRAVMKYNQDDAEIGSILCPGLGTAVGRMPPRRCALQMRQAYDEVLKNTTPDYGTLEDATQAHYRLLDLNIDFVDYRLQQKG